MEINIQKDKTALVVIDLQKGILGLPQSGPYSPQEVLENTKKIAEEFRKNNMPVFLFRVATSPDSKDALKPIADNQMSRRGAPEPDWADIDPGLLHADYDFVLTKKQWGGFYGTELDLQLRRRGIGTIVLCGISTNIGVESTARQAFEFGYNQIFLEDACTAFTAEEHESTFKNIFSRIGLVRKTAEVIEAL